MPEIWKCQYTKPKCRAPLTNFALYFQSEGPILSVAQESFYLFNASFLFVLCFPTHTWGFPELSSLSLFSSHHFHFLICFISLPFIFRYRRTSHMYPPLNQSDFLFVSTNIQSVSQCFHLGFLKFCYCVFHLSWSHWPFSMAVCSPFTGAISSWMFQGIHSRNCVIFSPIPCRLYFIGKHLLWLLCK